MIKINLCPIDELDNPRWWLVDASVLALVVIGTVFSVKWYLSQIEIEIDQLRATLEDINASEQNLASDLQRYQSMEKDEGTLQSKLKALEKITVSKISKFRTLVVLEHLANLRPEGVWYQSLKIDDRSGSKFELKGQAFDNLLVAELIMSLKATASQDIELNNIRSLVYFDQVNLEQSIQAVEAPPSFPELVGFPEFSINGGFFDRSEGHKQTVDSDSSSNLDVSARGLIERPL